MVEDIKSTYPIVIVIVIIAAFSSGCSRKINNNSTKNNPSLGFVKVNVSNVDCYFFEFTEEKLTEKIEWEHGDCSEGKLHGKGTLSWSWKEEDGSISKMVSRGKFDKGLREGEWKIHNHNGTLLQTVPFVEGKTHGLKKVYREDGTLALNVPYVDGKLHGLLERYDEDGNLSATIPNVKGVVHGEIRSYFPDGKLASTTVWTHGKEGCTTHTTDGRVVCPEKKNEGQE